MLIVSPLMIAVLSSPAGVALYCSWWYFPCAFNLPSQISSYVQELKQVQEELKNNPPKQVVTLSRVTPKETK